MSYLQVKNVVKSFGNNKVLENISIDFEKGGRFTLLSVRTEQENRP